ncbi:MAG TPA: RsmE family RNA methyltransferase [Opitutaceae bacterium]
MNLILFERHEAVAPLPRDDPRARHLLEVLRRQETDTFDAGLVDGPLGKGTLVAIGPDALTLTFTWGPPPPPPDPLILLIGLPRPQTARDILRDATTLGAAALHFVGTERSDPNYAASTLWSSGEWRRHALAGAAQAFATRVPLVSWNQTLADALGTLAPDAGRVALDNYEAKAPLSAVLASRPPATPVTPLVLALGPERGWGPADRDALRAHGFTLAHLGARVLRSETAVIAALTLARARLGLV